MDEQFDMVVIGAGPAGEKAAAQAAYFGKRVALVERSDTPGGDLVRSVVSTKTMREAALYLTSFRRRDVYGVGMHLEPQKVIDQVRVRADDVVTTMTNAVAQNIRRHGVTVVAGAGRLTGPRTVTVAPLDAGPARSLTAPVILLATGSRPFHPPAIPFDDPDVLDSDDAKDLDQSFRRLVVIGGGAVGCELASIFTALGAQVTLVDSGSRLLRFVDDEIADRLAASFRAMGIDVVLEAGHVTVRRDAGGLRVELGSGQVVETEKVVFAAGRVGNTEDLGLDVAGVATDQRGRILVDERYRTTAEGIYAAGDVLGPPALASVSMEQGRVAACYAFGFPFKQTVDPLAPFGVYSIPEVAMVGMTEQAAREAGVEYQVGVGGFEGNARAAIAGTTDGLIKLVFRSDDRTLLGVHIVGDGASELIHQGQAVLHFGGTIDYFIHTTFNVPTVSEAYKYAAYDGLQRLATDGPWSST